MSKKLKKKIAEITGLNGLDWEARQERATKILASPEWKQQLCNELIGLSFRELERYLTGVATEREKKEESYERKLEAYRTGQFSKPPKPMRRDFAGSKPKASNAPNKHRSGDAYKPRTLKEILAQVYAPRVCEERPTYQFFKQLRDGQLETQSADEVLQDSTNGDDSSGE